jgi:hypothetical protein
MRLCPVRHEGLSFFSFLNSALHEKCLAAYSAGRCIPEEGVPPTRTIGKRLDLKVGLESPLLLPQIEPRSFCRQTVPSSLCVKGEARKLYSLFSLWLYDKKSPNAKFEGTTDYDPPANAFRKWTFGSTVELHLSGRWLTGSPSGKFVENSVIQICLEITGYQIMYHTVLWLLELQIRRGRKV